MRWVVAALVGVLVVLAMPEAKAVNPETGSGCMAQGWAAQKTQPINNAGSASNLKLISGVAGQKIYICAINVGPVGGAVNAALVSGTQTTNACDTGTAGLAGGATAATGWQFAANGGLAFGNGQGPVAIGAAGADVCLLFSAATQVSGSLTYVQF